MNRIAEAKIVPPYSFGDKAEVHVRVEDSECFVHLFSYYDDELSFHPSEFIGLTTEEGRALFTKKDIAYLRS